jgi:hypothetical protein
MYIFINICNIFFILVHCIKINLATQLKYMQSPGGLKILRKKSFVHRSAVKIANLKSQSFTFVVRLTGAAFEEDSDLTRLSL